MLKVAIATISQEKNDGIKKAFCRFFNIKESEVEFYAKAVDSGVSKQPFKEETYQGALNRVKRLKEEFLDIDYYISCEAGIENMFELYFNVQVVCIFETKSKSFLWGKSSGWSIPSEDIEIIKKSSLDTYLRGKGISRIEYLLGEEYSRERFVAEATELALAGRKLTKKD